MIKSDPSLAGEELAFEASREIRLKMREEFQMREKFLSISPT